MVKIRGLRTTFKVDNFGIVRQEHETVVLSVMAEEVLLRAECLASRGFYVTIEKV